MLLMRLWGVLLGLKLLRVCYLRLICQLLGLSGLLRRGMDLLIPRRLFPLLRRMRRWRGLLILQFLRTLLLLLRRRVLRV